MESYTLETSVCSQSTTLDVTSQRQGPAGSVFKSITDDQVSGRCTAMAGTRKPLPSTEEPKKKFLNKKSRCSRALTVSVTIIHVFDKCKSVIKFQKNSALKLFIYKLILKLVHNRIDITTMIYSKASFCDIVFRLINYNLVKKSFWESSA